MIVTLFGITVITFLVTRLTPGEPAPVSVETFGTDGGGGYDSQLELNRRNLGLDKPLAINLNFEDRDYLAQEAVQDFLRPATFWRDIGETNLRLSSTISVPHVINTLERLQTAEEGIDHTFTKTEDVKQQINISSGTQRLLQLLPDLARSQKPEWESLSTDEQISNWRNWWEESASYYTDENAQQTVVAYLDGSTPIGDVLKLGGYAVPPLIEALDQETDEKQILANKALSGLTGFSYLSSPDNWAEEKSRVLNRWQSFYSREETRYSLYGPVLHSWNIIANTQFGVWFYQVVTLDFGESFKHRVPVMELVKEKLPITIVLSFLSIFFSYIISIPIGILSAVKKKTGTDTFITVSLFVLYSLPTFWTAQILLMALTGGPSPFGGAEWPNIFPTRGLNSEGLDWTTGNPQAIGDLMWHLVMPVFCLTYGSLAFLSRQMRSSVLETIKDDYIRTARAKGLNERTVVLKHALRNSLIPIITISAGLLPELIAGSIVIESIFNIPGMGLLSFEAILNRDYPVINAILFFSAALTLLGILIADLTYALVDPRIKYE